MNAIDPRELDRFYRDGTRLPALPPINTIDEIPFATGSLGHGLSLSAGMALGAVLERRDRRVFCLTSDGELDEGSTWEAALFIAHHKLTNVVWLIDRNRIQALGVRQTGRRGDDAGSVQRCLPLGFRAGPDRTAPARWSSRAEGARSCAG